jgi:putative addiction module component (TIGR02574 family)
MAHPLFDFSQLTAAERAQLAADLWDSIALDEAGDLPVPEEHRAEILRRLAAWRQDPEAGVPWEEARAHGSARGWMRSSRSAAGEAAFWGSPLAGSRGRCGRAP